MTAQREHGRNQVVLSGTLLERERLRLTPAGVPVLNFRLQHASWQTEAGLPREVECEIQGVALGVPGRVLAAAPLGSPMTVTGFLAAKSSRSRVPVLHVNTVEFEEGNDNGIQTKEQDGREAQGQG